MRRSSALKRTVVSGLTVLALLAVSPARPAESAREGLWQFQLPITYVASETFSGQSGTSVDLNGDVSFGVAFGYNFDEQWYLGGEFTWMDMGYDARISVDTDLDQVPDSVELRSGTLDSSSIQLSGQFNFMKTTVTPFVRANVGGTYIDSNIAAGPPQGYCWWYPYWGYVCDYYVPTYGNNAFSYGGSLGVRGDLTETFFLEAGVNQLWVDAEGSETLDFLGYRLNIGWTF
jgi:hypothetical protein